MLASAISTIKLEAGSVETSAVQVKNLRLEVSGAYLSELRSQVGSIVAAEKEWRGASLNCSRFIANGNLVRCQNGGLNVGTLFHLDFDYQQPSRRLNFILSPEPKEVWKGYWQGAQGHWQSELNVQQGQAIRLSPWLGSNAPKLHDGRVNAVAKLRGRGAKPSEIDLAAGFSNLKFADVNGSRAGENISGKLSAKARPNKGAWNWQSEFTLFDGEAYWQPWYAKTQQTGRAEGSADAKAVHITQAELSWPGLGKTKLSGAWLRREKRWQALDIEAKDLDFGRTYAALIAPTLTQPIFAKLKTRGRMDIQLASKNGEVALMDITLRDGYVEDADGRFILSGLGLHLPWAAQTAQTGEIRIDGARFGKINLGPIRAPVIVAKDSYTLQRITIPLLNGNLALQDVQLWQKDKAWRAQLRGTLAPISMQNLAKSLDWPLMHGDLSGSLPLISYREGRLSAEGGLLVRVFNGTVAIKNVSIAEVFSNRPEAHADVEMRNLDLDLLTRTFSFGNMEGRIDVDVQDLEMVNWRPTKFKANLRSSPGQYPKKISQRAVQNISSLGGAGPAAALQRSFLSFFDEFRYERIGLSCVLKDGLCQMAGIEPRGEGFVIVEGGGIPAITVLGYNREVSWQELVDRLARIKEGGAKPMKQTEKE